MPHSHNENPPVEIHMWLQIIMTQGLRVCKRQSDRVITGLQVASKGNMKPLDTHDGERAQGEGWRKTEGFKSDWDYFYWPVYTQVREWSFSRQVLQINTPHDIFCLEIMPAMVSSDLKALHANPKEGDSVTSAGLHNGWVPKIWGLTSVMCSSRTACLSQLGILGCPAPAIHANHPLRFKMLVSYLNGQKLDKSLEAFSWEAGEPG